MVSRRRIGSSRAPEPPRCCDDRMTASSSSAQLQPGVMILIYVDVHSHGLTLARWMDDGLCVSLY